MNIKQWIQGVLSATFSLKNAEDDLANIEPMYRMPPPKPVIKKKPKARKRSRPTKKLKKAA